MNSNRVEVVSSSKKVEIVLNNGIIELISEYSAPNLHDRKAQLWELQVDVTSTIGKYTSVELAEKYRDVITNDGSLYCLPFKMLCNKHRMIRYFKEQKGSADKYE
jgi:hypothetical protein